ncbi:MAG: hypothetical protein IPK69_01330 [Phycisphaerales bacterium]|nr:MAG: hypothetical protein IPK69_01330 [Phycisphaerales bacterium]
MLKWLLNRGGEPPFDPASLGTPWGDRPSVYSYVESRLDPSSGRLFAPHAELPDEPSIADNELRFSGGALDGISRHGLGNTSAQDAARVVYTQLLRTVERRDQRTFNVLHSYVLEHSALSYVDELNPLLAGSVEELGGDLAALGRHLLKYAADREVVKFAINLVGVCGGVEDHSVLLTIGAHDEFTLFAVVALGHTGGGQRSVWEMAKRVDGWGRIQCVERLDKETVDFDVRTWLLTEGYKNSVMTSYTAAICARRGCLKEALDSGVLDRTLIDGAAEILAALARGNPGEGMEGYTESALATERFLAIVEQDESPSAHWLLAARDIERYVQGASGKEVSGQWTQEALERCARGIDRIRARSVWRQVVAEWLESNDDFRFNVAAEAAQYIGIDTWEHRFSRLVAGKEQWYWLLETTDSRRLDRVLEFASTAIDLKAVTTGYGDALGFGPSFVEHRKLDWILQALQRWPGRGREFISAGFRSPVVRNRWGAVRAALRWAPEHRQPFLEVVRRLHRDEQKAELQAALARLLSGEVDSLESSG